MEITASKMEIPVDEMLQEQEIYDWASGFPIDELVIKVWDLISQYQNTREIPENPNASEIDRVARKIVTIQWGPEEHNSCAIRGLLLRFKYLRNEESLTEDQIGFCEVYLNLMT
jgi:hypothetical protein